jgi:hypothetical protein
MPLLGLRQMQQIFLGLSGQFAFKLTNIHLSHRGADRPIPPSIIKLPKLFSQVTLHRLMFASEVR